MRYQQEEKILGTDPHNPEPTVTGSTDGRRSQEVSTPNPLKKGQRTGMACQIYDEINVYHTDPNKADTAATGSVRREHEVHRPTTAQGRHVTATG